MTTQGMREAEMRQIAGLIAKAVRTDPAAGTSTLSDVRSEVTELVRAFPAYPR
ncbi:hypothetical protein Pflav_058990 [Phytohabitans flavus]|uniref:Serine hydroxymethyltransferase-like domain-containing protein n=1 Tax=Phytohabitans flavus TaxID=1076124 RepID=A0A6F8Y0C4_9ACTN|nr:hypothetical protein Pflav_058990 [Phytohabitans flavus]